jgi:hypothetical protein
MEKQRRTTIAGILVLALALSLLSSMPGRIQAHPLSSDSEARTMGGSDHCASAWGLGLGLAAASLSPCSIVCLTLAWYDLVLIEAFCDS